MTMLRYIIIFLILTVAVGALPSVACAKGPIGSSEVEYYMIEGSLTLLDKAEKTAVINGLTWNLIDDFSTKNIMGVTLTFHNGRAVFTESPLRIRYCVVLEALPMPGSTPEIPPADRSLIRVDIGPDDVKEINRRGGQIYVIGLPPQGI